ncbi:WhiB family transcriptional regulator [Streptomyces sp. NPDC001514]
MINAEVETGAAACQGADPALFFPADARPHREEEVEAAKNLCGTCPVRQRCLTRAVELDEWEGIWGGFTGRERRRMRMQAQRLRQLDRRLINDLLAGRRVTVRGLDRPAVVHALARRGWSQALIAQALGLEPFAVQLASATAADAELYVAAERRAAQGTLEVAALR